MRTSLTMIVKNEAENLPACLESVRGLFDETVIVDTGSTDATTEIARAYGARVFDFVWVGDFGAARNAALARARGDYAFWLDADDRVEPAEREKLERLLASLTKPAKTAYVVRCECDPDAEGHGATVVDHVRLFPVREDCRWTYRVHEQILPSLRKAGIGVAWSDVVVRHVGYVDRELRQRKLARDFEILLGEHEDNPNEPFVLFNLGSIALERGDDAQALEFLHKSLMLSRPSDSITKKLYSLLSRVHQRQNDFRLALAAVDKGLAFEPEDAELLFRKGILHRLTGDDATAEACWNTVLTLKPADTFSSYDPAIYGELTRKNLEALHREKRTKREQ